MLSRLRPGGARGRADENPSEAFSRDLFTGRLARPIVALGFLGLGVAIAYGWNAVSPAVALGAGLAIVLVTVVAILVVDRQRWLGQDVLLWQQAGRERRWRAETGGPSPIQHPAQAEVWLGAHPRGSVPQLYRVLAASLARDPVVRDRELTAFVAATPEDLAWREWALAAPSATAAEAFDARSLRAAIDALPEGDDRRLLRATLAVADALRRHHLRDSSWLEPLLAARAGMQRERLQATQLARLWIGRLAILLSFIVPAVALGASGVGQPEPFPAAYRQTTFQTRGEFEDESAFDMLRLARALPALAAGVAANGPVDLEPLDMLEFGDIVTEGEPSIIWEVDAIDLAGPSGVDCDHVWSVEVLLGIPDPARGGAIVTCDTSRGRAWLVPVDPGVIGEIRAAVGLPEVP